MTKETLIAAARSQAREEAKAAAAKPLTAYRLFWLFFFAGVAGDLIEVVFCLFWGFAALVWVRLVFPAMCALIDRVPRRTGRRVAAAAAVCLVCSTVVSAAALYRMDQRRAGVPAMGAAARFLDKTYPDSRLKDRYPNMGILDEIGW